MNETWGILLLSFVLISILMMFVWWASVKFNNFGFVDPMWTLSFFLVTAVFAIFGGAWPARKIVILMMVGLWSLRLGFFLAKRIIGEHPKEDTRYAHLRKQYGENFKARFFIFFQIQAVSVIVLSVPFLLVAQNETTELSPQEILGFVIWLVSILGESAADKQMSAFKKNPANKGKTCDVGLWKYSRHPNYFFESMIWWGYFIFALGTPGTWFTIYCPLAMLYLLVKVTGVPPSEAQALRSRGDEYREYQRKPPFLYRGFPVFKIIYLLSSLCFAEDRVGSFREVGKPDGPVLYVQKIHLETSADGVTSNGTITGSDGEVLMTETAKLKDGHIVSQDVEQLQIGESYTLEVKDGMATMQTFKVKDGKKQRTDSKTFKVDDDFVTGPVSEPYLQNHWEKLMSGEKLKVQFGIFEVSDTIGFNFKKISDDKDKVVVELKISSFLVALFLKPIELTLDKTTKKLIHYTGRTPLRKKIKEKWTPVDAEITYQ